MDDQTHWIDGDLLRCSFCRKWTPGEGRLVAKGPTSICEECLDLCDAIIAEAQGG
jgi:hypothetical protein